MQIQILIGVGFNYFKTFQQNTEGLRHQLHRGAWKSKQTNTEKKKKIGDLLEFTV